MARTNEQIDKINEFKKAHGEETLPYETDKTPEELAKEKEIADAAAAQAILDEEAKAKLAEEEAKKAVTPPPVKVELTKEEKEAIAKEFFGVADIADLVKKSEIKKDPTPEEIEAEKEKRENDKIAYALKNNKVSKAQYEKFIKDSSNAEGLVYAQFKKEQMELDSTLSDTDVRAEFEAKFGLDSEEGSRKYKRGMKEIGLLAESILKQSYANIYKLDAEYDSYETEQLTQKQINDNLVSQAPVYKQEVEEIYSSLKKMSFNLGKDGTGNEAGEFEVEFPDAVINALKEKELAPDFVASEIKRGYKKEQKASTSKLALIIENLPSILLSVAEKYHAKKVAGSKGIPPIDGQHTPPPVKKMTPEQEAARNRILGIEQVAN